MAKTVGVVNGNSGTESGIASITVIANSLSLSDPADALILSEYRLDF
ncbi:MAG: hypothetical protein ACXV8J_08180 [Methylobacter sp.]